jgi:CTP synthase
MKLIFVTGGVVSSLGKGLTAGALGSLLESCGHRVTCMKLDPYINVDPGTMSPSEHGEVYVTHDGYETDLDLGHYERFLTVSLQGEENYVTSGQVYADVIRKERRGDYLGKTVQVIPHITDHIQASIEKVGQKHDITLVEVGGTVGDIESLPFLESIRQLRIKHGFHQVMFVHLTLLPYIKTAGEMKTKPTQHSVKELRSIGIQPDVLICRAERSIDDVEKNKISLFTNVKPRNVISIPDVDTIYRLPEVLLAQQLHEIVTKQFQLTSKEPDLTPWNALVERQHATSGCLKIAIVGKYTDSKDAYKSLQEALIHAGIALSLTVDIVYVNADQVTIADLESMQLSAVLVPGGFGERGADGKIKVIRWARETAIPFLGICYGMQLAVVEFCRHVLGLATAHTTEVDAGTDHPVVCLIEELQSVEPDEQKMGGNMRLGSVADTVLRGSLLHAIYESDRIEERHRHRYEVNPAYVEKLEASGLAVSARSEALGFVDVVELKKHPWFVGCQFHPEFLSKPLAPHPLFLSFLKAAKKHKLN